MTIKTLSEACRSVQTFTPGERPFLKKDFYLTTNPKEQASLDDLLYGLIVCFNKSLELGKLQFTDTLVATLKEKISFTPEDSEKTKKVVNLLKESYLSKEIPDKLTSLMTTRESIEFFFHANAHRIWNNYYKRELAQRFPNFEKVAKTRPCVNCHFLDAPFLKRLAKTQLGIAALARFRKLETEGGHCKISVVYLDLKWLAEQLAELPEGPETQDLFNFYLLLNYMFADELVKCCKIKEIPLSPTEIWSNQFLEIQCPEFMDTIAKMKRAENETLADPMGVVRDLAQELVATQKTLDIPYRALYFELFDTFDKSLMMNKNRDIPCLDGRILHSAKKFEKLAITVAKEPVRRRDIPLYHKSSGARLVIEAYIPPSSSSPSSSASSSSSLPSSSPTPVVQSAHAKKKKKQAAKKKAASSSSSIPPAAAASASKTVESATSPLPTTTVSPTSVSLSSSSTPSLSSASPDSESRSSCSSSTLVSASLSSTSSSPSIASSTVDLSSSSSTPPRFEAAPPRVSSNFSSSSRSAPPTVSRIPSRTAPSPFSMGPSPIKKYHPRAWAEWQPAEDGRIEALDRKGYAEAGPLKRQAGFMRHAFTQFVDRFVGGPYSMYIPASASCPSDTYLIYGEIQWTDSAGKSHITRGQFSYGIDNKGICFHRYLTRKTTDEMAEEFLLERSPADYPSLAKSHCLYQTKAKDLSDRVMTTTEGDISYRVGPLDTITFRDEENNCTITLFKLERE